MRTRHALDHRVEEVLRFAEANLAADNTIITEDELTQQARTLTTTYRETLRWDASGTSEHNALHTLDYTRNILTTPFDIIPFGDDGLQASEHLSIRHNVYEQRPPEHTYSAHATTRRAPPRLTKPGCLNRITHLINTYT